MSRTPQQRIISLTTGTVMATGLGMIPLHRLPRAMKIGYIVMPAAFGTGAMLLALRRHDSQPLDSDGAASFAASFSRSRSPAVHATLPLAVGGIIAGSSVLSLWMDRGIEEFLHRRGVPAPRLAMALASGALSLAMGIAEERREAQEAGRTLEERVLATLSEADPMRLEPGHRGGAPGDEFLREAEMIAVILRRDGAIDAAMLDQVWEECFDRSMTELVGATRTASLAAELTAEAAQLTSAPSAR